MAPYDRLDPDLWAMKWRTFCHHYSWPDYVNFLDGWLSKVAYAVPIVGYLLLFNDSIAEHLSFDRLSGVQPPGIVSGTVRLQLVYIGLMFLGTANAIYYLRRPQALKIGRDEFEYVENALRHFTLLEYVQANDKIHSAGYERLTLQGKYTNDEFQGFQAAANTGRDSSNPGVLHWAIAKAKYEGLLRSILIETYFHEKTRNRLSLSLALLFAGLGYVLLLIPSLDLFLRVMTSIAGKWLI